MKKRPAWLGPLVAVVVVYAVFAVLIPDAFLRPQVLLNTARGAVVVTTCALGMTMVIVTGGIDLSTGSVVALSTVIIARMLRDGSGPVTAVVVALVVSTIVGAITGTLVGKFKMLPFIVTLGMMSLLRGSAIGLADEQKIDPKNTQGLEKLLSADITSPGIWITVALCVLVACVLTMTRFGRHVFAVGSNEAAARLCGIDPARVKILVYASASLLFGIAGVMEFSTLTVGDPTDSVGLELDVIAAVVIGGASLTGGEGTVLGSVCGVLLLAVIKQGGISRGMPSWTQLIVTGLIIIVANAIDRARARRAV